MKFLVLLYFLAPALILAALAAFYSYRIGLQQQVYHRQGIEITKWELFMGCTPAVKVSQ